MALTIEKCVIGAKVPSMVKVISLEAAKVYAGWPERKHFHSDEEYACKLGFPTVVVMALQTVSCVSQLCVTLFGRYWATSGTLAVDILKPVLPPQILTCKGIITQKLEVVTGMMIKLDVWVDNQIKEKVLSGTVSVILPKE